MRASQCHQPTRSFPLGMVDPTNKMVILGMVFMGHWVYSFMSFSTHQDIMFYYNHLNSLHQKCGERTKLGYLKYWMLLKIDPAMWVIHENHH